jgi:hypothetical protein
MARVRASEEAMVRDLDRKLRVERRREPILRELNELNRKIQLLMELRRTLQDELDRAAKENK